MPDHVDALIGQVREQRSDGEPLYVTAARVFHDGLDELSDVEIDALETVGFEAVKREGAPSEIPVPSVVRMIEAGRPYDHVEIDPEDRPGVLFLGFLALAAETLIPEGGDDA